MSELASQQNYLFCQFWLRCEECFLKYNKVNIQYKDRRRTHTRVSEKVQVVVTSWHLYMKNKQWHRMQNVTLLTWKQADLCGSSIGRRATPKAARAARGTRPPQEVECRTRAESLADHAFLQNRNTTGWPECNKTASSIYMPLTCAGPNTTWLKRSMTHSDLHLYESIYI